MDNLKIVEGYLPIFNGFYNSVFENLIENEDEGTTDIKEVVKLVFEKVTEKLKKYNFISQAIFENLNSPKEYNYYNDSINCQYIISQENLLNIYKYIRKNKKEFKKYLKENYTSYSGFISSYSNNLKGWTVKKVLKNQHQLSSIFEFILQNQEYNEISLYYDVVDCL